MTGLRGGRRPGSGRKPKGHLEPSVSRLVEETIDETLGQFRQVGITEPLLRELAIQGLASIYYHARRGNLKASMYLVDRLLGTPERPFSATLKDMTEDEVRAELQGLLGQAGFGPEMSAQFIDVFSTVVEQEAVSPLSGLPAIQIEEGA